MTVFYKYEALRVNNNKQKQMYTNQHTQHTHTMID